MATSLSRIKNQIEKLQKKAATLQNTVVSRIKREIAQHGLTAEDLFSADTTGPVARTGRPAGKSVAKSKSAAAAKSPKYADGQGNTWHGIGKRPQWIHAALNAGRSLEEFLSGANVESSAPSAKTSTPPSKKAPNKKSVAGKTVAAAKGAPLKKAAKTASTSRPAAKASAPTKVSTAGPAARGAAKAASKKTSSKKVAPKKSARSTAPAVAAEASAMPT